MWTVTGDFDGLDMLTEVSGVEKTKLLKTDKAYTLGRKEALLNVNVKKISRSHGIFTVGEFTEDHVMDPATRPTLQYTNTNPNESRVVHVQRGDDQLPINVQSTMELEDGDIVSVASRVLVKVRWHAVCCYQQAAKGKSGALTLASCAALGVHLVHTAVPQITHHITTTFAATTLHAFSLVISAAFVKPEWLNEVIRLGNLPLNSDPSSGLSLEQVFDLPPVNKYRPTFSATLAAGHKTVRIWDPNEERMSMFSDYRFYCMGEAKRQIDSDLREVIERAAGRIETLNVAGQNASEKFTRALARCRAKTGQKIVLIADEEACQAAIGKDGWQQIAKHAPSFNLRFFAPRDIIQAILDADASILDPPEMRGGHANAPSSSPLPNVIPNTHPEENSITPDEEPEQESEPELPPPRKLTRRVSSRQASQEPKPIEEAPVPPRRHLTRRAQPTGQPVITGLDDPSVLLNNLPETSVVVPAAAPVDTSKPRSRLKRRVGTSTAPDHGTLISDAIVSGFEPDPEEERPLKKFKALFEASDPKNSGAESFVQESGAFDDDELAMMANVGSQSQTQAYTQTQSGGSRTTRGGRSAAAALRAVREEEEEETQMAVDEAGPSDLGKKRKERSFDGDDVEMAGVEDVLNGATGSNVGNGPAAKKQAVAGNAVERTVAKQPSAVATAANAATTKSLGKKGTAATAGAATGKPDTDTVFLKAIASTKRGKKTEDDFDRDFNKLKISKSGLRDDEPEQRPDWELMETFGDESNLRGNFMVIQDLEVFKTETGPRKRAVTADPRYEGKPDWKKFKKNKSITAASKKKIELFAPEENDAGLGRGYWKGANSQPCSEDDNDFRPTQKQTQAPKVSRAKGKSQAIVDDSDEDVEIAPKGKRSKPPSKAEPPKKRAARGASKVPDSAVALFIKDPDDDDDDAGGTRTLDEDDFDGGQTLQSSAETGPARRSGRTAGATKKKAAPIIVDDDSDNEGKFTGWAKQKAKTRR
ncbi:proline-rich protein [Mycena metata]|uniref:Proline-rich protein n=1 Tax=Mycena metata TaxID=1033252 RepID=A0AAD7P1T6_9AGAR|nr:proline-rich protein [Mycena metata]